jgi:hypothetical protein
MHVVQLCAALGMQGCSIASKRAAQSYLGPSPAALESGAESAPAQHNAKLDLRETATRHG